MSDQQSIEFTGITKFIYSTLVNDDYYKALYVDVDNPSNFFSEVIDTGVDISTTPAAMFVTVNTDDVRGNFQTRLFIKLDVEIKAVMSGADIKPLNDIAGVIDRLFDWTNQQDPDAGRPRCQELWTDPDTGEQYLIMGMWRNKQVMYPTYANGINYSHLGGEYHINYYKL